MGIIKTGKIQSHGNFSAIDDRVTVLEDKYVRYLWFAEISSGTSGTITPPTGGTIVLDQWAAGVDAVTSTLTTTRNPTFESVKEADGTIITATLASNGAWTISGTPSAYPIAILYVYEVKLVQSDRTKSLVEIEADQGLKITDSPTFAGLTNSSLTASLVVVTDANKKLSSGTNSNADISDAVTKKHTQGTDTALGAVGTKNPPIDADLALYRDSAASNVLVTSTWTQVKAFLKTYFDGLYNLYVHPNHSGEVTSVADGAQTIANDAVTYAKMQNVSDTDKILGRSTAGAGDIEEIACTAAGRALLDDATAAAQATTLGLGTADSPTFVTAKLSGLTDDYIPYHVSDAAGFANGPTKTNVDSAVSLKHTQGSDTALGAVGTKDPPIDADKAIYRDSTAGDALVTSTWTQVKAFLKTYFDTLYEELNALTFTAQAIGWTGVGGTTSKTLTVSSDADTKDIIKGDGTAGRVLRLSRLYILNGTDPATIKPQVISIWNGDSVAEVDNLGKGGSGGNYTLEADGSDLRIIDAGITGSVVATVSVNLYLNLSGTALSVYGGALSGGLRFVFYNAATGAVVDLTTLVDTGNIYLEVFYLTSA